MRITMQYKMFLIKYAEIGTKGKNRYVFEEIMCKRMRARLKPLGKFEVRREYGRIFVEAFSDYDYEDVMKVLTTIFGIVGVCPVKVVEELSYEAISKAVVAHVAEEYNDKHFTFKVNARRNNKTFPKTSMELNCDLGADLLDAYPDMTVDIHKPIAGYHRRRRYLPETGHSPPPMRPSHDSPCLKRGSVHVCLPPSPTFLPPPDLSLTHRIQLFRPR